MGGSETDPGIFINWSLRLGTTASRCITFNKFWPISRDLVFDIRILELWVVNEVFMKKRHISKRDFYSTVVMWNRIGRHKAKEDRRRADRRDCCYHNGITNYNHSSHGEIHETDERHFEPSNPSLVGDNNIDDELLTAIKNRLAGVPPMPGALSLKPEAKLQIINQERPMMSTKPQYLANRQSSRPNKVPPQVSTQVDDNMITELKNQGTSTSQLKVTSRCTQSGTGVASHMEGTAQLRHSASRIQQADEGYQRALPLEQNTQLYGSPSRTLQSDEQYQRTLQPRRNSFPNHTKQSLPAATVVSPRASYADPPPVESVIGNSIQSRRSTLLGLPEVPDFYGMSSSQRPSVSRSVRSSIDEAPYNQQTHELSWTNRKNMGAILPYQQQLVRSPEDHGDLYEDTNLKQSPPSRSILRDEPREVNRERSQIGTNPYQVRTSPSRSIRETESYQNASHYQDRPSPSRSIREVDSYQRNSQFPYHNSPSSSLREVDSNRRSPPPKRSMREELFREPSPSRPDPTLIGCPPSIQSQSPPPEERTVITMTTQQVNSVVPQLCKCGSKEMNLVCGCDKSTLKEVQITRMEESFRECRSLRKCDSEEHQSKNKKKEKKKKDKKGKADKEAKAEEKRRKKEEKEREKLEKARQKAREKEERKKSKVKGEKKNKKKGDENKECRMCSCCKCCGEEGETTIVQSETSHSEDRSRKRSKKEKKPKEKKEKEKRKGNSDKHSNDPPIRSCECPPIIQTDLNDSTRLSPQPTQVQVQQLTGEQPSVLGFCNHPDIPCPALGNREMGRVRDQSRKTFTIPASNANYCGDPACTNAKQIKQCETSVPRSCSCNTYKALRSCCCSKTSGGCSANVCSYVANASFVEQPNVVYPGSTNIRGNSPTAQLRTSQSPPRTNSINTDAMSYRDITAAPALVFPNEAGHGDTAEALSNSGRSPIYPRLNPLPPGFCTPDNVLIDLSNRGRENSTNKHYVPPCVLYLDCTKVKDLCVIIKDKYEDPS